MWGVDGIFAFYPVYLVMLIAGGRLAAALSRRSVGSLAQARIPARR